MIGRVRCAIYTRKSSEEGLEQDFNSLDAQREACEAYVVSQKQEGWELLPERYDDGGLSGGHLDRPALQRLLEAVDARQVDQIVVYKIDRLTRSLADFAKIVERLDGAGASFVSVTQSFNTATSMGRLTLNMLLSFAQFEREVTAERIRDKIAASKRKGLWMGGQVPIGYDAHGRTLRVNDAEAATIRTLYDLYQAHGTIRDVADRAQALGLRTRRRVRTGGHTTGGGLFDRGHIHHILTNPLYAGRIRHKSQVYEGQHPAIIDPTVWEAIQEQLSSEAAKGRGTTSRATRSPLAGKLFDESGDRLTPSHSRKRCKRLRYYISRRLVTDRRQRHPDAWRLPAEQLERLLGDLVRDKLSKADAATRVTRGLSASEIVHSREALRRSDSRSDCLCLIDRVDLRPGALSLRLSPQGIADLIGVGSDRIDPEGLTIEAPFQRRRRGVELKLCLGAAVPEIDRTLVSNIVKARRWLQMILDGRSFAEIAASEGTSRRRVQDIVDLAMLAPDIMDAIAHGTQPVGLTSDRPIKSGLPVTWADQRQRVAEWSKAVGP